MSILMGALVAGCGDDDVTVAGQAEAGELGFYSVTLSVGSPSALPACTKALTGRTDAPKHRGRRLRCSAIESHPI